GPGLRPRDCDPLAHRDRPRGRLDPGRHPAAAQRHPPGQAPPRPTSSVGGGASPLPRPHRDGRPRRPPGTLGTTNLLGPPPPSERHMADVSCQDPPVRLAQRPTLSEEVVSDPRSRVVIEPLEPGFGYTLGSSLRRTLLSSIPGAPVTSIRIDGVLHEFSTVPGVKEDVTEFILNLKSLVGSSEFDEPVVAYLRKQGPGTVTAADVSAPAGV